MTEPVRLMETEANPEAKILLVAGLGETPPPGSARRVLMGLGLATGVASSTATTTAASPAAAPSAGAATLGGTKSASVISLALVAKWIAGVAIVGLLATLALSSATPSEATKPVVPETSNQAATRPAVVPVVPPTNGFTSGPKHDTTRPEWTSKAQSAARVAASAPAQKPRSQPSASVSSLPDPLVAEVALLDEARAALAHGDSTSALRLIERHQREYKSGRLGPEAFILRLTALMRAGQAGRARALADAWLATHPKGPRADRVREIVGE